VTDRLCAAILLSLLVLPAQAAPKPAAKGEIAWKMVKVRHGRFQAPHLTRYRDPKVVKSVNRQIDAIIADLGCGPEKEGKDGLEIGTSVKLAARDIFSVYISGSYFCGTYPENDDKRSTTFDLRTGRPVEFEGLFKDYTRDRRAILSTIFADQVATAPATRIPGCTPWTTWRRVPTPSISLRTGWRSNPTGRMSSRPARSG